MSWRGAACPWRCMWTTGNRVRLFLIAPERVVFGTDQYSATTPDRRPERRIMLDHVLHGSLAAPAKQAILAGNIQRLLRLVG